MRARRSVVQTGVGGPIDKLTRRVNRHTAGVRVMRSREVRVVCQMWQVGMRMCRHWEWITLVIHLHFHSKSAPDYLQHWISIHFLLYNLHFKGKVWMFSSLFCLSKSTYIRHSILRHRISNVIKHLQHYYTVISSMYLEFRSQRRKKEKLYQLALRRNYNAHYISSSIVYESCLRITRVSPRGDVFLKVNSSSYTLSLIGPPSRMTITNVNYFYIRGVDIRSCGRFLEIFWTTHHISMLVYFQLFLALYTLGWILGNECESTTTREALHEISVGPHVG